MMKNVVVTLVVLAFMTPFVHAQDSEPLLGGNLLDVIDKGGVVMVVILLGSIVGLALAFERLVSLRKRSLCPGEFMATVRAATEKGDWEAVENAADQRKGPLARILKEGLKRRGHGPGEVERTMESVGGHEVARLKRPVRPLAVLATVQPLLGLLGTIIGMIATFNLLGDTSPADRVQKLAPGIGQALYTTAAGLCVSIPFVVLYHFFVGKVNRVAEEWSLLGSDVILAMREGTQGATEAAAS